MSLTLARKQNDIIKIVEKTFTSTQITLIKSRSWTFHKSIIWHVMISFHHITSHHIVSSEIHIALNSLCAQIKASGLTRISLNIMFNFWKRYDFRGRKCWVNKMFNLVLNFETLMISRFLVHNLQTVQSIWEISGKRYTEACTKLNNSHDDNGGCNENVSWKCCQRNIALLISNSFT